MYFEMESTQLSGPFPNSTIYDWHDLLAGHANWSDQS